MKKEDILNEKVNQSLIDELINFQIELSNLIEELEKPPAKRATIKELMDEFKDEAYRIYEKICVRFPIQE